MVGTRWPVIVPCQHSSRARGHLLGPTAAAFSAHLRPSARNSFRSRSGHGRDGRCVVDMSTQTRRSPTASARRLEITAHCGRSGGLNRCCRGLRCRAVEWYGPSTAHRPVLRWVVGSTASLREVPSVAFEVECFVAAVTPEYDLGLKLDVGAFGDGASVVGVDVVDETLIIEVVASRSAGLV